VQCIHLQIPSKTNFDMLARRDDLQNVINNQIRSRVVLEANLVANGDMLTGKLQEQGRQIGL
jgi:hypothetical protein